MPLGARVSLARASVQVLADSVGARLLHIKGETVDESLGGLRPPGSDVDALVDPGAIRSLHHVLLAHGWSVYSTFTFGSPFEHAQTYAHEVWGYFDLHRRFPGVGLPDQAAFDLLWPERIPRDDAGVRYDTPGVEAQAVLLLLNEVRNGRPRPPFWADLDDAQRADCEALVTSLDAGVAFAAAHGELESMRGRREYRLWKYTLEGGPRVKEWWARAAAQPTRGAALRVLIRAPRVNTDQLRHRLGRAPSRGRHLGILRPGRARYPRKPAADWGEAAVTAFTRGANIGVIDDGDAIYVAPLPDGPILVLRDVSAMVWREVVAGGVNQMVAGVAKATGASSAEIEPELLAFVDDLCARGLLVSAAE